MEKRKSILIWTISLALLVTLVGFSAEAQDKSKDQAAGHTKDRIKFFTIGGAGVGGRWYSEAGAIANLLTKKVAGLSASAISIDSVGYGNINAMAKGQIQAGVAFADQAYFGYKGIGRYDGKPQPIYGWFRQNINLYTVVATKEIKDISQLKGKVLGTGTPGSGDKAQALVVLNAYGINESDVKWKEVGRDVSLNALIDNQIDAAIFAYSRNNQQNQGRVLKSNTNTHLIGMDPEKAKAVVAKVPYLSLDTEGDPKLGYPGLVRIGISGYKLLSKNVSDDQAYEVTKALWDNAKELYLALPWFEAEKVNLETAADMSIRIHPGALKYYKEKGVKISPAAEGM